MVTYPADWADPHTVNRELDAQPLLTRIHDRPAPPFLGSFEGMRARIVTDPSSQKRAVAYAQRDARLRRPGKLAHQSSLLHDLLGLRDGSEERTRSFVERYGALGTHARYVEDPLSHLSQLGSRNWAQWEKLEPLSSYKNTASRAFAILAGAAAFRRGELLRAKERLTLAMWTQSNAADEFEARREVEANDGVEDVDYRVYRLLVFRRAAAFSNQAMLGEGVEQALNIWMREAGIAPWVSVKGSRFAIDLGGVGLSATIAFQVAAKVTERAYALCAGCQDLFATVVPTRTKKVQRAPQSGRRAYCRKCREDGKPQEDADADRRARARDPKKAPRRWKRKLKKEPSKEPSR